MTPVTPLNVWLICGRTIAQGCTCNSYDPTPGRVQDAIRRLATEQQEPESLERRPPDVSSPSHATRSGRSGR